MRAVRQDRESLRPRERITLRTARCWCGCWPRVPAELTESPTLPADTAPRFRDPLAVWRMEDEAFRARGLA